MDVGGVIILTLLTASCPLTTADVALPDGVLRVRDVVQLDCLPAKERGSIGELVIGDLREHAGKVEVTGSDIADAVRRRVPGLPLAKDMPAKLTILVSGQDRLTTTSAALCVVSGRNIAAGEKIVRSDVTSTPCPARPPRPVIAYEAEHGVVRALADIPEGEALGRLMVPDTEFPDSGDELLLIVKVGPVSIERRVWAMQPAPRSGELFVRDEAGNIFPAPIDLGRNAERRE